MDDILNKLYKLIQVEGKPVDNGKGTNKEILGVYIRLLNPLSRVSRSFTRGLPISPLGELFWYLSGSDQLEFIKYYLNDYQNFSDDGKTLYGAYGKRLFHKNEKINQIDFIVKKLRENSSTRQAVIQIYDAQDLMITSKDIPCTCTLQFIIRENKLHLFTTMRSNDAYKGFVHDVFSFTIIQEIISRLLGVELGYYNHFVSSMHLYDDDERRIKSYLGEGYQSQKYSMLPMPSYNIENNILEVLQWEKKIREGNDCDIDNLAMDDYWKDILILLKIYALHKKHSNKIERNKAVSLLKGQIKTDIFKVLIEGRYKC